MSSAESFLESSDCKVEARGDMCERRQATTEEVGRQWLLLGRAVGVAASRSVNNSTHLKKSPSFFFGGQKRIRPVIFFGKHGRKYCAAQKENQKGTQCHYIIISRFDYCFYCISLHMMKSCIQFLHLGIALMYLHFILLQLLKTDLEKETLPMFV